MPKPENWIDSIAELRDMAKRSAHPGRRRRLLDLADRWFGIVQELRPHTKPPKALMQP